MSFSVSAGRISYALGLKGPSYIVDTACSSASRHPEKSGSVGRRCSTLAEALVALDCSATALRKGRCSSALNTAANVMASPTTRLGMQSSGLQMPNVHQLFEASDALGAGPLLHLRRLRGRLRPRGRRRRGAAAAGARERAPQPLATLERCGLLGVAVNQETHGRAMGGELGMMVGQVLPLTLGMSQGTRLLQDGRSSTLTAPNGPSQATVMRVALAEAKMQPEEVAPVTKL
eukprot:Skav203409  [mRNA]  locus=scaffold1743:222991:225836:- [translate_table: standard]